MENIVIDNITIVIGSILMAFAIVTPLFNGFIRKPKAMTRRELPVEGSVDTISSEPNTQVFPKVSVILTPHENAYELEQNLPLFWEQDYPAEFEIIVVAWKGDSATENVLKRFADNKHLYSTFIPESTRYMSRKKLAVTLGVKAAKYEWLLLTDIECRPQGNMWLRTMAHNCTDDKDLVIGYTCYDDDTEDFRRFERLHTAFYLMREDQRSTPYRHNGNNLMFRKSMFISQDGFRGNLKYLRGEYDFIVNKYATRTNTALELDRRGWMVEQKPTNKNWLNKHLFYMENRQHLWRTKRHRILFNIDQTLLHLNYLLIMSATVYATITARWILAAIAGIALMITVIARSIISNNALHLFSEDISIWKVVPYELSLFWHALGYKLRYMKADKYNFISHKL